MPTQVSIRSPNAGEFADEAAILTFAGLRGGHAAPAQTKAGDETAARYH
jgi:hypothetical protein